MVTHWTPSATLDRSPCLRDGIGEAGLDPHAVADPILPQVGGGLFEVAEHVGEVTWPRPSGSAPSVPGPQGRQLLRVGGRSSPKCSRRVVPSYSRRNRPRSCKTGINWSVMAVKPAIIYGA